jgi:hypothetical protein
MLSVNIKNGTPLHGDSLCDSCYWAHIMRGYRESELVVTCQRLDPNGRVPFPVRECTEYRNKNHPTRYDMEQIAWILLTKKIDRKVGFVNQAEFRKIFGDDVEIIPEA